MSVNSHVEELRKKHQILSDKVDAAQRAPSVSQAEITELKKQKLKLKEEIEKLSMGV